jgi:hypothetical protein
MVTKEKYVVDKDGKRVGVVLEIDEYKRILEDLEELEAIRAYDAAKSTDDDAIPFEQAVDEIKASRK